MGRPGSGFLVLHLAAKGSAMPMLPLLLMVVKRREREGPS